MEITTRMVLQIKIGIIVILVAASSLTGCGIVPKHYQAAPINGKVIDINTGAPVEGVHVAVYWQYYDSTFVIYAEGKTRTIVKGVSETTTDKNGNFYVPGWEGYVYGLNELGSESPIIGLYKKGYIFKKISNFTSSWGNDNHRTLENRNFPRKKQTDDGVLYLSIWDDFPAEIEKTNNDLNKIVLSLNKTDSFIDQVRFSRDRVCHQKFMKKFISAYISEAKEVKNLLKKLPKEKEREIRYPTSSIKYLNTDLGCE